MLTGVLVRRLVTGTSAAYAGVLLLAGVAVTAAVLIIRLAWIWVWTVVLRALDRRPQQREIRVPSRARLVTVWGGLRGGISLAAALTIPAFIGGIPFDHRADLLVLTFVVALSLLVQVPRWGVSCSGHRRGSTPPASNAVADARQALARRTLDAFDDSSFLAGADPELRAEVRRHPEAEAGASGVDGDDPLDLDRMRLQLAVLERKRHELIGLLTDRRVEDSVMWDLQHLLDREESRLGSRLSTAELATTLVGRAG